MNNPLNYWLLFTSLGFTVPFPPCFLSSITCPALTYLPVHLFRASILSPSLSLLRSCLRPSCHSWAQEGGLERGRRWEDREKLKKNRRDSGMPICLCVSMCASDSCVWIWLAYVWVYVLVCLHAHSHKWTSSTLASVIFTHCKHALTFTGT